MCEPSSWTPDAGPPDWTGLPGRDLSSLPAEEEGPHRWGRIVACLNVWNDLPELEATLPSWIEAVDALIAVDGAYKGIAGKDMSTDGTLEYLASLGPAVEIIHAAGLEQPAKRSQYWKRGRPGDLFWILDADELVEGAERIRDTPYLDVGWITYRSPLYRRLQGIPRVFQWRPGMYHAGRHHWVFLDGHLVSGNQQGGRGYLHRLLPIRFANSRGARRPAERVQVAKAHRQRQAAEEAKVQSESSRTTGWEPLRILQIGRIDPGLVVFRLHSAINRTTPHASAMFTLEQSFMAPRQFPYIGAGPLARALAEGADVLHLHRDRREEHRFGIDWGSRPVVLHHHGTAYRTNPASYNADPRPGLRLVSNLELLQYADAGPGAALEFLPNPIPVRRYERLRNRIQFEELDDRGGEVVWPPRRFRIVHSPSKRARKATDVFLAVCDRIRTAGIPIEPVLLEDAPHWRVLEEKARAHACFDSFDLGLQCSGLEAAAMGVPVIAGDGEVRKRFEAWLGYCPYSFADSARALEEAIERLWSDVDFYLEERRRVSHYVGSMHDEAAVTAHYLDLLDRSFNWRDRLSIPFRGKYL